MERLRRLRTEKGLSQARLAARAELDPSTVNQIERGAREASPATLRKLADALDVGIAELLEESGSGKDRSPRLPLEGAPVAGPSDPTAAVAMIGSLRSTAEGLASAWNQDVDLYERNGLNLRPYRTMEMGAMVVVLYQHFWGALDALRRHVRDLGHDDDVTRWDPESKRRLLEAGSSIRALAELRNLIERSAESPGSNADDFRAMREEFDAGLPEFLVEDPLWPEEMEKARAMVGLA